jgi:hypothetical protein
LPALQELPSRTAAASPYPRPSQPRRAASTGGLGTDLGPRVSLTPGVQGQGRTFPFFPAAPEPKDSLPKFLAGGALAAPSPPAPAGPALVRAQCRALQTMPIWSPLTSGGHGSGRGSQSRKENRSPRGVGRKISPTRTAAHTRRPGPGASRGTPAPRAAGRRGPAGRGHADS